MTGWLTLTNEQRKATIDQAEQLSGISAKVIEKDWWVTLTLKALFSSIYSRYIVFKGGTSLSKCWRLIARFSEDVDIALSPEAFGMKYVKYPSLYTPSSYIADEVKVEASVRSLRTPYTTVAIHSLLNEHNPNPVYGETLFEVDAVEPRKTFLEKAFLLHEEFGKPDRSRIKSDRMSRHLYDLGNIMNTPFGQEALNDFRLYDYIVKRRESYNRISWVNYKSLKRSSLSFIPPDDLIDVYRQDYSRMQEQMIYGDTLSFDDLIGQLKKLQNDFRKNQ
ncbi:nucleotidyl transferase AbiEii/AbiGii toxin family protein [Niastella sp. OAS944]|uniref:nucleotidyl transferase AbiEii/AbiGii toxin family protein n=1 Tax=Niastella sp. OAS944 TaxID=2664089 RepID=UPI0034791426|nr:hypothetical protein [Chitinophagaceae bacterium OAS944]